MPYKVTIPRACEVCAATFDARYAPYKRFCSLACFGTSISNQVSRTCVVCATPFTIAPSRLTRKGAGQYCSYQCRNAGRRARTIAALPGRFAALVKPVGDCHEWQGPISQRTGYGILTKRESAHRYAWVLASKSPIPKGLEVGHVCDNRPCVRNDEAGIYVVRGVEYPRYGHLWLGPHYANMFDMIDKGRKRCGPLHHYVLRPENILRGERNGAAVLTEDAVREIRAAYAVGNVSQRTLARQHGVSQVTIGLIVRREKWRHVV